MSSLDHGENRPGPLLEPTAERFRVLFGREPSPRELRRFRRSHAALVVGLPARARREVARLVVRC